MIKKIQKRNTKKKNIMISSLSSLAKDMANKRENSPRGYPIILAILPDKAEILTFELDAFVLAIFVYLILK
jgi:NurA-like 5'-3' nuclease